MEFSHLYENDEHREFILNEYNRKKLITMTRFRIYNVLSIHILFHTIVQMRMSRFIHFISMSRDYNSVHQKTSSELLSHTSQYEITDVFHYTFIYLHIQEYCQQLNFDIFYAIPFTRNGILTFEILLLLDPLTVLYFP